MDLDKARDFFCAALIVDAKLEDVTISEREGMGLNETDEVEESVAGALSVLDEERAQLVSKYFSMSPGDHLGFECDVVGSFFHTDHPT